MVVKGRDVGVLLKKTGKEIGDDKIPLYAAQMAYNFFFSLFPLCLFVAAMLGLVADKQQVMGWMGNLGRALPPDVASLFMKTLDAIVSAKGAPGILSFGILITAWSGSAIIGAFMDALNAAYDVKETRPWWKRTLIRLVMLVVTGVVLLGATVILVNGEGVVSWVGDHLGLGSATRTIWNLVQFPLAIFAIVGLLWLQYYFLPNCRHQNKAHVWVGAIVAAVLWLAATMLFRLYVQKFHAMNPAYGAIGAIMVLLTWMYYSSFVLLAAGELNSELEHGTGLVGATAPASAREAAKVDREEARGARGHGHNLPVPAHDAPLYAAARGAAPRASAHGDGRANGRDVIAARTARTEATEDRRGIGALLKDLADGGVNLIRRELELARLELGVMVRGIGVGTALVAFGGVMALLGVLALFTGITLLPGDQWLRDQYWLGALIVTLIAGAVAAWFVRQGMSLLSPAHLQPTQTIETLKEDAAWAKHQKELLS